MKKKRRISNSCSVQVSGSANVQCLNFERGADSAEMISGRSAVSAPPRKRTQDTEVDSKYSKLQTSCVRPLPVHDIRPAVSAPPR